MGELRDDYTVGTFLNFYHGDWQDRLDAVAIPHMEGASWDRRAAYLLWLEMGGEPNQTVEASSVRTKPAKLKAPAKPAVEVQETLFEDDEDNWSHLV